MTHQPKRFYKRIKDSSTKFKTLPQKQKIKVSSILLLPLLLAIIASVYLTITFDKEPEYEIADNYANKPLQTNFDKKFESYEPSETLKVKSLRIFYSSYPELKSVLESSDSEFRFEFFIENSSILKTNWIKQSMQGFDFACFYNFKEPFNLIFSQKNKPVKLKIEFKLSDAKIDKNILIEITSQKMLYELYDCKIIQNDGVEIEFVKELLK